MYEEELEMKYKIGHTVAVIADNQIWHITWVWSFSLHFQMLHSNYEVKLSTLKIELLGNII